MSIVLHITIPSALSFIVSSIQLSCLHSIDTCTGILLVSRLFHFWRS